MATPVNDTYTAASGAGIYGGKYNWPTWRRAIAAQHWAEVGSNTLASIDPEDNPAYNPNYSGSAPWHGSLGQPAMITAWNGGCYDSDGDVLWLIQGGGHGDYGGNEPYKIDLSVDSPTWEMVRAPSTDLSGDGANGLYGDGRPRSVHTYNKPVYIPNVGPALAMHGATYPSLLGVRSPLILSPTTGEMTFFGADNTNVSLSQSSGSGACYDPSRHCIWTVGGGSPGISRYDIATDTWYYTGGGINSSGGYIALEYMPDHDCIFMAGSGYTSGFRIVDCATLTTYTPVATGSMVGMTKALMSGAQVRYVQSEQRIAVWNNTSDTTQINVFNVPVDPMSGAWTIEQLSVGVGNTVTPTTKASGGTYGRFFHSQKLDGFGVINSVTEQIFFYARS